MPTTHRPADGSGQSSRVTPEVSVELVDMVKDLHSKGESAKLEGAVNRFNTVRRVAVFMEYDIQLFDVNREQYRRIRIIMSALVFFTAVICVLNVSAEALCEFTSSNHQRQAPEPCTLPSPMSCFSGSCASIGLACHASLQCLCPGHEPLCNTSLPAPVASCGAVANYSFEDVYHDCEVQDGLLMMSVLLQSLSLLGVLVFALLYWRRLASHTATASRKAVRFFTGVQRITAVLAAFVCVGKVFNFAFTVHYMRYGVLWDKLPRPYLTDEESRGLDTAVDILENIGMSISSSVVLFAPILLFTKILSNLPAQMWDTACHLSVCMVNTMLYLSVRIVFGYMYGQTFGYVPFMYIVSIIQVCNEAPPESLVAEMEVSLIMRNGPATEISTTTAAASATTTTADPFAALDDSPLQVWGCTETPAILWVGIAAVFLWEVFLLAQVLYVRHSLEKAILSIPYPQFRAIILYYRFVDALWRLLSFMLIGLGGPMALANRQLFRWSLWEDATVNSTGADEIHIVPLKFLGTTFFGGPSLDVFFSVWLFGLMYLHLPRFYFGLFLEAFCPNKLARLIAKIEGDVPQHVWSREHWGAKKASSRHLQCRRSMRGAVGDPRRHSTARHSSSMGGLEARARIGRHLSNFRQEIMRHERAKLVEQADIEDEATLDPRSSAGFQKREARDRLAAECKEAKSADFKAKPSGASDTKTSGSSSTEQPASPSRAPTSERRTADVATAAVSDAHKVESAESAAEAALASSQGVRLERSSTHQQHKELAETGEIEDDNLPPGGLNCFIDIVYADFVKSIVKIYKKLGYTPSTRGYKDDEVFHGELKQLLGPVRYDQFVADNETLQIIDNEGSKNHCWMLRSVPQEGLVVVFPGSSHFENFFNAMNINAIPWESVAECQYRSAEEARERGASRVHPKNSAKAESLASNRAEGTGANEDGGAGDVSGGDNAPRPPRRSSQWRRSIRDNHVLNVPPSAPIDCRVHAGFFNMYKTLRHAVMRGLKEHLAKFPKTAKITITGHSLGGVFSSFLALDMLESGLVQDMNRVHVSLYGSPCAGNLAFKKYYDSVLPATLQFGMWNDPIIMYPPQPCQMVYWHCVGKDVILLPALQFLVEPSQLELYFIQLGHADGRAHRRFTYYHAVLRLLLDPESQNSMSDVSVSELERYLWSLQLMVRRSPPELNAFYKEYVGGHKTWGEEMSCAFIARSRLACTYAAVYAFVCWGTYLQGTSPSSWEMLCRNITRKTSTVFMSSTVCVTESPFCGQTAQPLFICSEIFAPCQVGPLPRATETHAQCVPQRSRISVTNIVVTERQ